MDGFNNRPTKSLTSLRVADNLASNITGILSTRPQAKYVSGARCVLKINDKLVGFAFAVSWRITTSQTEIQTIDDPLPYELAPQKIAVEGSISALHIPGESAGTRMWQPDILSFLQHKYITIEVRDSVTDELLFLTSKASITSRTEDIRVDSLSNVTLTWKAVGYRDEREPKAPPEPEAPPKPKALDNQSNGLIVAA